MKYRIYCEAWKGLIIMFSLLFLPCMGGLIAFLCFEFNITCLICVLVKIPLYALLIAFSIKIKNKKDFYIQLNENEMEIKYRDLITNENKEMTLPYEDIVGIEYYRLFSIRVILEAFLLPLTYGSTRVIITYKDEICKKSVFVGYMNVKDIKKICEEKKIDIKYR